jgi:adenylosuccinate synthase
MPISVVVGGQYGSEGKGKVALELVRRDRTISTVVRPGGTNSGHTGYTLAGKKIVLRQLPAAAIDRSVTVVLPAGSYIDVELLLSEIARIDLPASRLVIDPRAHIIRREHIEWEKAAGLLDSIASTGSGTGAAVMGRIGRGASSSLHATFASEMPELAPFVSDSVPALHAELQRGNRVLIEGTQGFGLSPIHGDAWPKSTSRDTTAAGFLSEAGLSPIHVDQVILVLRSHPIRVGGDSGPLPHETTWAAIARNAGATADLTEKTSVTHKLRRVGIFEPGIVRRAIAANSPTEIVLNHLDHVDWESRFGFTRRAKDFIEAVERDIGQPIARVGTDPFGTLQFNEFVNG